MSEAKLKLSNDRVWLERMCKSEDYGCISVGGLYARKHPDITVPQPEITSQRAREEAG